MHIAQGGLRDRANFDCLALELADILHDWDPIGVYRGEHPNPDPTEYDDLVIPTLRLLKSGIGTARLTREFREVLRVDYRLTWVRGTFGVARACKAWWRSASHS